METFLIKKVSIVYIYLTSQHIIKNKISCFPTAYNYKYFLFLNQFLTINWYILFIYNDSLIDSFRKSFRSPVK